MTETAAGPPDRLDRQGLDARLRPPRRPSELPLHRAGRSVPIDRSGVGESRRRADQRLYLRRPHAQEHAARLPGLQLGARRLPCRHDGLRGDGGGDRRHRDPARPDGDAAVLRLQHGATTSTTGWTSAARSPTRRAFSASTGSAATTTASSCGPASARTCAC